MAQIIAQLAKGASFDPRDKQDTLSRESSRTLRVADFRNVNAIKAIDNNEVVTLRLGSSRLIEAFGITVPARVSEFKGKIPGSEEQLPPIHFLTPADFQRIAARSGDYDGDDIDGPKGMTLAWFDKSIGDRGCIEIPIPGFNGTEPPDEVKLSGFELKRTFCSIQHEAQHAAGKGEFCAYRAGYDFGLAIGYLERSLTNFEIMIHIRENYELPEIIQAEEEFHKYCVTNGCLEQEREYWQWVDAQPQVDPFDDFGRFETS